MMKALARSEKSLSRPLKDRTDAYALAATAAGVGFCTLSMPAAAEVVFTPVHLEIGTNQTYNLDVNNDGIVDFTLFDNRLSGSRQNIEALSVLQRSDNRVEGYLSTSGYCVVAAVRKGQTIGPEHSFCRPHQVGSYYLAIAEQTGTNYRNFGRWPNQGNRYLGLLFKLNGQRYFGWARLSVQVDKGHITARLIGYAYESVPNKPIEAGRRLEDSSAQDVPDPQASNADVAGSLGKLALGAQGISSPRP